MDARYPTLPDPAHTVIRDHLLFLVMQPRLRRNACFSVKRRETRLFQISSNTRRFGSVPIEVTLYHSLCCVFIPVVAR